jgi:hypothetical protein
VVTPGFIDLHAHGQDDENYRVYALDGVTTALEMEVGTADIPAWYAARAGKALVNYGATISHVQSRMKVLGDPSQFLPSGEGGAGRHPADRKSATLRKGCARAASASGSGCSTPRAQPNGKCWRCSGWRRTSAPRRSFTRARSEPGSQAAA